MKHKQDLPRYMMIALDIAYRISRGEFTEGQKIKGRSMLSVDYNVSPETIRKATSLLQDQGVLEIKEKSGIIIKNSDLAVNFIESHKIKDELNNLNHEVKQLLEERKKLDYTIENKLNELIDLSTKIKSTDHFIHYELPISESSHLHNKSIQGAAFWLYTHATIIGVKRKDQFHISPGPNFVLQSQDMITFVCLQDDYLKTKAFIERS